MRKNYGDAIPLFNRVLVFQRAHLSPDHQDVLITMHNLGAAYRDTRRFEEAEPLLHDAVERGKRVLGFEHTFVQTAVANLADLHFRQGKPEATESVLREMVDYHRTHSGPRSQVYDDQLGVLFNNLMRQKKFTDAESVARERLAVRAKNFPDAWSCFQVKTFVGDALVGQKRFPEAEALLLEGYQGIKARENSIPSAIRAHSLSRALERVVKLYEAWGKEAEAAKWRQQLAEEKARTK
jgi:tetratricopeptide (TPR) repeat protein